MLIGGLCIAAWCVHVGGQQQQPQQTGAAEGAQPTPMFGPPPPATRLEGLASQKGILITKGYSDVGEIQSDDGSRLRLTAVQFSDAQRAVEQGLVVTIEQRDADGGPVVAYVDAEELDGLSNALDALAKMEAGASPLNNAEGVFRTRGELEFTNHVSNGSRVVTARATQILIPSGQVLQASATFRPARLSEIRQQIAGAQDALKRARETVPTAK
jgi:hypothetical protein